MSDFLKICDLKITYWPQKLLNLFSNIFVVKKKHEKVKKKIKRNRKENHNTIWPRMQTKCL